MSDPFLVKNSGEILNYIKNNNLRFCRACSFDVEDLYYSIPHDVLLKAVKDCIEENSVISFRNACGISVDAFVDLIAYYLRVTYVSFDSNLFL